MHNGNQWVPIYLSGKICPRGNMLTSVHATFQGWFDGAKSAMYAIVRDQPTSPRKLLREIDACLAENNQGQVEMERLQAAQRWALREATLSHAARALADAAADFAKAAADVELDEYDTQMLFAAATAKRQTPGESK